MSDRRSGICAAVRDFVRAHPGATGAEIKDGIAGKEARKRSTVSAILSLDTTRGYLRCEESPGTSLARPIRRYWIGDVEVAASSPVRRQERTEASPEPATRRERPEVPEQPPVEEGPIDPRVGWRSRVVNLLDRPPAAEADQLQLTRTPAEVQHYEPLPRRTAAMPQLGEHEIAVVMRHVMTRQGPAIQFEIPAHSYIDMLRRYR